MWPFYSFGAAMSSDICGGDNTGGICDPDNQALVLDVPLLGWAAALVAGWLLVLLLPGRIWRASAITLCWAFAVGCLLFGYAHIR